MNKQFYLVSMSFAKRMMQDSNDLEFITMCIGCKNIFGMQNSELFDFQTNWFDENANIKQHREKMERLYTLSTNRYGLTFERKQKS